MRSVSADRKLELEQELIRRGSDRVVGAPILAAHLAELARPVCENRRAARIAQQRVVGAIGSVEADARKPSPRELVIRRDVEARGVLQPVQLLATAPDDFGARDERVVDRTLQRTPSE